MFNRNEARLRRARKTRAKIAELKAVRLCINRTNCHIYAQVISPCGGKVLASASTLEADLRALDGDKSAKARKVLGWNPQYTDVEVVISTAWKWHQAHPEGYKK